MHYAIVRAIDNDILFEAMAGLVAMSQCKS